MKLQYLAVIFVIIIMPIVLVLSQYVDYNIDAINLRQTYDTKLLDSTYDSIKAYQLNTVNNAISDISASKIEDLEAAVKTFFNSLSTTFGYTGYNSSVMKNYIPAVVFTMYDGYYIYSPYQNVLTGVSSDVDEQYKNDTTLYGLKPYVYYSCRYVGTNDNGDDFDIIITYTLDNYITIQGNIEGEGYINQYGYLVDGITKNGDNYIYDGITFSEGKTEQLKEYIGDDYLPYVKLNGTKYYLDGEEVFYINASGERATQISKSINAETFGKYKDYILNNNSAYKYYKSAYNFTNKIRKKYGLSNLTSKQAVDVDGNPIEVFSEFKIFGEDNDYITTGKDGQGYIQDADSNFNAHRSAVIRYTIEKNLAAAIAGYTEYSNIDTEYIMPKISETDWEIVENNVSIATFLQGFKIGGKDYNEYCVVANNLNKEYVDENDIYIIGNDKTYYKANDTTLKSSNINNYSSGIWKLNFERKSYKKLQSTGNYETYYYYPISWKQSSRISPYMASYSSVVASTSVDNSYQDLYKYMRELRDNDGDGVGESKINNKIRDTYYTALARERWGQYSVNNEVELKPGELVPDETPEIFEDNEIEEITLVAKYEDSTGNMVQLDEYEWTNKNIKLIGYAKDTKSKIKGYVLNQENTIPSSSELTEVSPIQTEVTFEKEVNDKGTGVYTYYFYAKDASNNIDYAENTIYVDKTKPVIDEFVKGTEDWTNQDITLTGVMYDEHSGITNYSITQSESVPSKYDNNSSASTQNKEINKEISENGTYYLHVKDQAGNTEFKQLVVGNIDKMAPTINVTPSNSGVCKNTQIKIKITDNLSGVQLNENGELNGVISLTTKVSGLTDEGEETEVEARENYEYTAKMNEKGELEATITIGENLTGVYKLYAGEDISDKAGNITEEQLIGEFIFDNEEPLVEAEIIKQETTQNTEVKLTIIDEPAGFESDTLNGKIYLSTSQEQNDKVKEYDYTATKNSNGEYKSNIEIDSEDLTGIYYVWIDSISDMLKNSTGEIFVGEIQFDNIAPTVTVNPDRAEVCKSKEITITLSDEGGSGLKSNEGMYYLSTSRSKNSKTYSYSYISGEKFTIGNNLTGTYFLWVGDVEDNAGNKNVEHCVGEFIFDNDAPIINSFEMTSSTSDTISVKTKAIDSGSSGIASYKYYIVKSNNGSTSLSGENKSTSTIDEYTYNGLSVGETYKLCVIVTDSLGNSATSEELELELTHNYMIITGSTIEYKPTLADAISVARNGSEIKVLTNVEDVSTVTVSGISNLKINLNGNTINRGTSIITIDSTSSVEFIGKGYLKWEDASYIYRGIVNSGICTINFDQGYGFKLEHTSYYTSLSYGVIINSGTVTMKSGKIESTGTNAQTCITGRGSLTIDDGEIVSEYGVGVCIYNVLSSYTSKTTMNGGKILAGKSAILVYIPNYEYEVQLNGGLISGGQYGVEQDGGFTSKVIVGNKVNTYSKEEVTVVGGKHAIYASDDSRLIDVFFYNGILKTESKENDVLSGAYIQEARQGYSIIDEKDEVEHYKYLNYVGTNNNYAIEDKLYSTLEEATTAAKSGDTIVMLKPSYTDSSKVELKDKDVTLLLNSYTLTKSINSINIGTNASMTITGNNARLNTSNITAFTVSGTIKMYGIVTMNATSYNYPIFDTVSNGAIIDISNGIYTANRATIVNLDNTSSCYIRNRALITLNNSSYGVYNSAYGSTIELNVYDDITVNSSYCVYNTSNMECILSSNMQINNSSSYIVYNNENSSGFVKGEDGRIYINSHYAFGIYNQQGSTIKTIIESTHIYQNGGDGLVPNGATSTVIYNAGSGDIEINGGALWGSVYVIRNLNTGNIEITGGDIRNNCRWRSVSDKGSAITNTYTGNITIENGYINGNTVGIYNTGNATIEIKNGTVSTVNESYGQGYYAIYNTNSNAKIVIGDVNRTINTNYPRIVSENTSNPAIYTVSSKFEFNNGRIESGNSRMYNTTPKIRDLYKIIKTNKPYTDSNGVSRTKYIEYLEKN